MRVDSISRNTHLYDTLDTAINSMANFFDPSLNTSERVPLEAVRLYLKEKGLNEFLTKFNNKFGEENNSLQLASEIQSVLKAVIPEEEIELEDVSKSDEDEFIAAEETKDSDTSEKINQEADQADVEKTNTIEEDVEQPEQIVAEHTDPVVASEDDYHVIENQDILSENHLTDQTNMEIETVKENNLAENEATEFETPLPEEQELVENRENETPEIFKEEVEEIKETREKPNTKGLIRKLINLFPIYDSLIKKPKPFENTEIQNRFETELLDTENNETKYQMDISTLHEELIIENESYVNNSLEDNFDGQVSSNEYDEYMSKESLLQTDNQSNDRSLEIGEKIDEIVTDQKYEEEFINQVTDSEEINKDIEEIQELPEILEDEKLKLLEDEDKEITEVFTDLSFLDKSDDVIIESDDTSEIIKSVEEETILENDSYQENN